jgi:preprotein translocase subunit SecD
VLSQADGEKLKKLTSENVGKQLALLIGSQVVLAPYIREPISDGEIMLELPDSPYSILLKALKAHSLPIGAN